MKKYNVSNYYYLKNSKKINKEEIKDGATKFNNQWFTNYGEATNINIKKNNKLSIYIPSTIDINKVNNNIEKTIKKVKEQIKKVPKEYKTQGAWKSEKDGLVYEDIIILTIDSTEENFIKDLNNFINIAENLKVELTQEAVSVGINSGLLII